MFTGDNILEHRRKSTGWFYKDLYRGISSTDISLSTNGYMTVNMYIVVKTEISQRFYKAKQRVWEGEEISIPERQS